MRPQLRNRLSGIVKTATRIMALLVLVLALYFIGTLIVIVRQVPAKYQSFTVQETAPTAGDTVHYDFAFCRNVGPEVTTNIVQNLAPVDSKGNLQKGATAVTLAVSPNVTADKGCSVARNRALVIPQSTPAGCYRVHRIGQYYKLVGFKPASVDIYSNVICVKAATAPNLEQQLQDLQTQLDQLRSDAGMTVSEAPQSGPTIQVAEVPAQSATTSQVDALQPTTATQPPVQPQQPGILQSTVNFLTRLL